MFRNLSRAAVFSMAVFVITMLMAATIYAQTLGEVTANKVNVRDAGSLTDSNVLYMVDTGQQLEITGVEGDYYQANINGDIGVYIASEYVQITYEGDGSEESVEAFAVAEDDIVSEEEPMEIEAEDIPLSEEDSEAEEEQEPSDDALVDDIIDYAKDLLGVPYVYGSTNPKKGFDCSGFVSYVLKNFDVDINRSSRDMAAQGVEVDRSALEKGDLVFFATMGGSRISHVGIFIGDGDFIHSSSWGEGVVISELGDKYYSGCYVKGTRIL